MARTVAEKETAVANTVDSLGMVRDVTVRGIDIRVDLQNLADVDVLYKLRDANNGDLFASLDLIDLMVGEDQRVKLVDTIRDPHTGRASVDDLVGLLEELLGAFPKL